MDGIGSAIVSGFVILAIITFIIGGVIVGGVWYFTNKNYIESKTIITPEIKLETDGKKIDTLYIYIEKNNKMNKENFVFFWGGTYSQWCPSPFIIDGVEYNCCEQYMMAKKALMFNDFEALKNIMATDQPDEQKALGRMVKGFEVDKWVKYCRKIVYDANYAKFTQNSQMKRELMATGIKEIVEASPEDKIWGIGLHSSNVDVLDKSKWRGTNWLGEAIMQVRNTLKDEEALYYKTL